MLSAFAVPLTYLDYELRKDFIAEYLCVNKDKPQLQCHGQCHLSKEVKKAEKQQQNSVEKSSVLLLACPFVDEKDFLSFDIQLFIDKQIHKVLYLDIFVDSYINKIFHPPC